MGNVLPVYQVLQYGVQCLDKKTREQFTIFLRQRQSKDGGFLGNSTQSDLYYSFFNLSCLLASRKRPKHVLELRDFLESFSQKEFSDIVHLVAWVNSWKILLAMLLPTPWVFFPCYGQFKKSVIPNVLKNLQIFQKGISLSPKQYAYPSVYENFLVTQLHQNLGWKFSDEWNIRTILQSCENRGGFCNQPGQGNSTTTNTSAALILAKIFHITLVDTDIHLCWLKKMFDHTIGGFRASTNAPYPDVLSTAVALYCLYYYEEKLAQYDLAREFIASHWVESGGFGSTEFSQCADSEYSFYALLGLGSLFLA